MSKEDSSHILIPRNCPECDADLSERRDEIIDKLAETGKFTCPECGAALPALITTQGGEKP